MMWETWKESTCLEYIRAYSNSISVSDTNKLKYNFKGPQLISPQFWHAEEDSNTEL